MPVHHRLRFLTFPMRASRLCSLWSGMRPLRFSGGYIARRRPGLVQDRRRAIWHRRTILLCRPEPGSAGRRGGRAAAPRSHRRSAFWRQRPSRERPRTACGRDVRARTQAERVGTAGDPARLGLRNILSFVAQSPTPPDHCVRFASAVAATTQHSLPGGALPPYRGRSFTGRISPGFA